MLKKSLIAIVVIVVLVLAYATTRPDTFSVQRSTTIKAPPEKVYALIDDFHRWGEWSPWEKLDPALKRDYSGPAAGVGAAYAWSGDKVGAGRMEIKQATPASKVGIQLDFLKPFEAHNTAEFVLVPQGDSTQVTWTMRGPAPFVTKLMTVFVSMDKMIGKDFESGLAAMKAAAEK